MPIATSRITTSPPITPPTIGPALLRFFGPDIVAACVLAELPAVEVARMPLEASVAVGGTHPMEVEPEEEGSTWRAGL